MTSITRERLLLAGSAGLTSYVFFGVLADQQRGVIPLITGRVGRPVHCSPVTQVGFFANYLPRAGTPIIACSYLSVILSFTSAYTHPNQLIRRLSFVSGLAAFLLAPLTFGQGITKINSELFSIYRSSQKNIEDKQDRIEMLIKLWEKKHINRYLSYAGAWIFAFAALVLDGQGAIGEVKRVVLP
ncbi:hypothetical protein BD324DRAFT_628296 [Kockovaella imperatae]|uniref:DUF1772-domain-containing protein n=1 Tax=Kockovaella imperatae TaxID=4999 RepID=A0A1Y1UFP0_9TREE|nr:hypothetical protein BD324DRAFT_628296 [Kockovaella imperatae]ORX36326.1 hypothetical protein BD324DRAFT_628296 [Kockovaella imperatae]